MFLRLRGRWFGSRDVECLVFFFHWDGVLIRIIMTSSVVLISSALDKACTIHLPERGFLLQYNLHDCILTSPWSVSMVWKSLVLDIQFLI